MATYAIGDLQGCWEPFRALLRRIDFNPARDRLWLAGDLVNRGPGSLEILRWVTEHQDAVTAVLGNHDLHLLAVAEGVEPLKRSDTFDALLEASDRDALLTWLRARPLVVRDEQFLMVHAGLLPQWTTDDAVRLAGEVETVLQGSGRANYLRGMRGNLPDAWREELSGIERLRVLTNAFTRLRFCTKDGRMEFAHNEGPEERPAGFLPWFDAPQRASAGVTIVCGHWAALGLHMRPNLLALDSGCVWGNALTAVRLEDRTVYQVPCRTSDE